MNHDYEKTELKEQISQLHKDNERQQSIIGEVLRGSHDKNPVQ